MGEENPAPPGQGPGGAMVCALRFGAKRVQPARGWTLFTRRFVRGIFRHVHAVTKNDLASFRRHWRRKPGRGFGPFLDFSQDGRGRCAARWRRGTGVPGGVPASVEGACGPARRGAALPAGGPLRRRDEGRETACGRCAARQGTGDGARKEAGTGLVPASLKVDGSGKAYFFARWSAWAILATWPLRTRRARRLGMTMRPLNMSLMSQTRSTFWTEPTTMKARAMRA